MIKSPYYFVPFAPENAGKEPVFFPGNDAGISHDHPYQDGVSGHLEIELEATTPIYIRNAGDHRDYRDGDGFFKDVSSLLEIRPDGKNIPASDFARMPGFKEFVSFYQLGNKPAIPGTSIKGVIRSVLQMVTKGRCEPFNDRRYSIRDLDSQDYKSWFKGGVHAGFVRWNPSKDSYDLIPCRYAKILQSELENLAERKSKKVNLGSPQSAEEKYRAWLTQAGMDYEFKLHVNGDDAKVGGFQNSQEKKARIVFVGQTAEREGNSKAKKREYVFFDLEESSLVEIPDGVWQGFLDSHEDTNRKPTESWAYWKTQIQRNPQLLMPVFYLAHETVEDGAKGNSRCLIEYPRAKLHSFGLSMLYRLPYRLSLHDAISRQHRPPEPTDDTPVEGTDPYLDFPPDFPSLLLGEAWQHRSLKGRISFGHLVRSRPKGTLPAVVTVLGGPKPSYYPNYMVAGKTLMNPDARFRGWKFYAARSDGSPPAHAALPQGSDERPNLKVATAFEPLAAGNTFRGKVRFHNLRPHELGALVWALTWGGRSECRHRIGMAKPLGYGCVRILIRRGDVIPNDPASNYEALSLNPEQIKSYCDCFETWLESQLGMAGWLSGQTVETLVALARHNHGVKESQLRYPVLDPDHRINEFKDHKQNGETLPEWLDLLKQNTPPPFTFWPDWMLPREEETLGEDGFPGDAQRNAAASGRDPQNEGEVLLCEVIRANQNTNKVRVKVVHGQASSEGQLTLTGDRLQLFSRLVVGRQIAAIYTGGGPNNRYYKPFE